jgi:2-hydroxychromene-2-carboxylate isomerase
MLIDIQMDVVRNPGYCQTLWISEDRVMAANLQIERCRMLLEFISDYRSPYSYLANTKLKTLGMRIEHKPLDIVAVMKLVNNQPSPTCPPKARYAGLDAARWAKLYGARFSPNLPLLGAMGAGKFDGSLLSRAALVAQEIGMFDRVNDAIFEAVWAGDEDLVTDQGRSAFLRTRDISIDDLWQLASAPKIVELQVQQAKEAADRGVFGAPTFFVDDEMFFGNDRLGFVVARLQGKSFDGTVI